MVKQSTVDFTGGGHTHTNISISISISISICIYLSLYIYIYIGRPQPMAGGARQRRHYKHQVWTEQSIVGVLPLVRPSIALCFGVARPRVWRLEGENLTLECLAGSESNVRAGRRAGASFNSMVFRRCDSRLFWRSDGHNLDLVF